MPAFLRAQLKARLGDLSMGARRVRMSSSLKSTLRGDGMIPLWCVFDTNKFIFWSLILAWKGLANSADPPTSVKQNLVGLNKQNGCQDDRI